MLSSPVPFDTKRLQDSKPDIEIFSFFTTNEEELLISTPTTESLNAKTKNTMKRVYTSLYSVIQQKSVVTHDENFFEDWHKARAREDSIARDRGKKWEKTRKFN